MLCHIVIALTAATSMHLTTITVHLTRKTEMGKHAEQKQARSNRHEERNK